jgi:hypothetical protein
MDKFRLIKEYPLLQSQSTQTTQTTQTNQTTQSTKENTNTKIKIWKAEIYYDDTDNIAYSYIENGFLNKKKRTMIKKYDKGKYIGKFNEITPLEKCILDTNKKWEHIKNDLNYDLLSHQICFI